MTSHQIYQPLYDGPAQEDIEAANRVLACKDEALAKQARESMLRCEGQYVTNKKPCGELFKVKDADFIQTYDYVSPYGCTDGDYWSISEGIFVCPHCGRENRMFDTPAATEFRRFAKSNTERKQQ